ncbi:alkaline phosphatase D family protein [Botrimarina hoheduenensis]|uniref:PhoD-like phosphatase n=1 Tax=Botrimarina hoheduenensis TaxID=2528000 RepID=A0A5C5VQ36_9BACT|nr:alkaline phosphatase D family protein [Botrimarina hoheduenensis]TWT40694.1 PhoD-like phosphatase [Botrimarina hoheduenensis]
MVDRLEEQRVMCRHTLKSGVLLGCLLASVASDAATARINWNGIEDRRWPGPAIWANRLQDWSVNEGRLKCVHQQGGGDWRTAHLLSHDLGSSGDLLNVEVDLDSASGGHAGVLLGGGEGRLSYRQASLIQGAPGLGGGYLVDVAFKASKLCIRDFGSDAEVALPLPIAEAMLRHKLSPEIPLTLAVEAQRIDTQSLLLIATLTAQGDELATVRTRVDAERLVGNAALVSRGSTDRDPHRFSGWRLSGDRVAAHAERAYGPVAGVLYSVANGDLKVGVQCLSVGRTILGEGNRIGVRLEKRRTDGSWEPVGQTVGISEPDYYALIRVRGHDSERSGEFRVVMVNGPKDAVPYEFLVPAEPNDGELVIGGISCTGTMGRKGLANRSLLNAGESYIGLWSPANQWAPFSGITEPLIDRDPDIVFFTGDQLYEWWPTPTDPTDAIPFEDYLYKWLIWHRSFKDVTSRVPCLLQTDDHDVWHPNLWGDGPRLMTAGGDSGGGFIKSSYFVNLVQRTMCGHNPDPFDPGPSDSGITNYYCTFRYGGVDFALLEDRKFKSAASSIERGEEPSMLGDAQLKMLSEWATTSDRSPVRLVVSQTNYVTLNTNKQGGMFADKDSNGWPRPARDKAVRLFKKAGALLFTGDQHLASVTRMETPTSADGVYQFSQPPGGCIWWRWFYPNEAQRRGSVATGSDEPHLGRFVDAFGNRFEALAVANPGPREAMPLYENTSPRRHILSPQQRAAGVGTQSRIHQGEGFAVIQIDIPNDRITLECWPDKTGTRMTPYRQFDGWPLELELREL